MEVFSFFKAFNNSSFWLFEFCWLSPILVPVAANPVKLVGYLCLKHTGFCFLVSLKVLRHEFLTVVLHCLKFCTSLSIHLMSLWIDFSSICSSFMDLFRLIPLLKCLKRKTLWVHYTWQNVKDFDWGIHCYSKWQDTSLARFKWFSAQFFWEENKEPNDIDNITAW